MMLASQAIETGIGLAVMMFFLSTAASGLVEVGRRILNSRSKDLEIALMQFFTDQSQPKAMSRFRPAMGRLMGGLGAPALVKDAEKDAWVEFQRTSVYRGTMAARNQVRPAYLSAMAFAEAVEELRNNYGDAKLTGPLAARVQELTATGAARVVDVRAGLERWYDEAMSGLSARYAKKSTLWLFFLGLLLAGTLNASFPHVARDLWTDSVTRATVVAAAEAYYASAAPESPSAATASTPASAPSTPASSPPASSAPAATPSPTPGSIDQTLNQVADATAGVQKLGLPIGWPRGTGESPTLAWVLWHALGWIVTAALVSLGAPFWFDMLGRLTALRSPKPAKAADDETSATRKASLSLGPVEGEPDCERAPAPGTAVQPAPAAGDPAPPSDATAVASRAAAAATALVVFVGLYQWIKTRRFPGNRTP